jgi:hypothetical protein
MIYLAGFRPLSFWEYRYVSWPLPPSSNHRGSENLGKGRLFPVSVVNAGTICWIIDRPTISAVPNDSTSTWICVGGYRLYWAKCQGSLSKTRLLATPI